MRFINRTCHSYDLSEQCCDMGTYPLKICQYFTLIILAEYHYILRTICFLHENKICRCKYTSLRLQRRNLKLKNQFFFLSSLGDDTERDWGRQNRLTDHMNVCQPTDETIDNDGTEIKMKPTIWSLCPDLCCCRCTFFLLHLHLAWSTYWPTKVVWCWSCCIRRW